MIVSTYRKLLANYMKEEALFLYLTYSICVPPSCLWLLRWKSIKDKDYLLYWDPTINQSRSILLDPQTKRLINEYENDMKLNSKDFIQETRTSNDKKTKVSGTFMFSKKPTNWNNLFKNGFNRVNKKFSYTDSGYQLWLTKNENCKWSQKIKQFTFKIKLNIFRR